MATDRRREKQADAVAREVASSGVRVESDSGYQAVLVEGRRVNHLLQLLRRHLHLRLVVARLAVLRHHRRRKALCRPHGRVRQHASGETELPPQPGDCGRGHRRSGAPVDPIAHGRPSHTVQRNSVENDG